MEGSFFDKLKALMDQELKDRLHGEEEREAILNARINLICDVDQYIRHDFHIEGL